MVRYPQAERATAGSTASITKNTTTGPQPEAPKNTCEPSCQPSSVLSLRLRRLYGFEFKYPLRNIPGGCIGYV